MASVSAVWAVSGEQKMVSFQSGFFGGVGAGYQCIDVLICGSFLRHICGFCFRFWAVSSVQEASLHPEALHQPEL